MLQHTRNAKVADLYLVVLGHKDILGLEITMQDFAVVDVLDCKCHLHEPVQDLIF